MYDTVGTRSEFDDLISDGISVLVSQRDGRVSGQSRGARMLLGAAKKRTCWSLMQRVPGAAGLPCKEGCVKARLSDEIRVEAHSIALRGRSFELRCEPVGDQVVTTLRPEPADPLNDSQHTLQGLTPREVEVLELLAEGLEGNDIADRLGICPGTVRTHVEHMRARLDCRTRAALVAKGYRLRYLR